jgi:glycosyltransferase involved in cell wall biosynthesis
VGTHPWHGVLHRCYRGSAVASTAAAAAIAINQARGTWARDVDLFLALSEFAKCQFVAGGIPHSMIEVKPNFVNDPGPRARPPSESGTLLYVGRLSIEKGVDRLIEMSRSLERAGLELLVVGDGPMRQALGARQTDAVRLLGPLPGQAIARLMSEARALIFPSIWYEGQPVVILEAFAAGLPVLGSDLGGISELLAPLGNEWLVDSPLRAERWDTAIAGLLDDDHVDEAGRRVRETFEARFHPAAALSMLEATYRSII